MKPSLRNGWISEAMDQKRPSLILDFQEEKCGEEEDGLKGGGGNSDEETRYFATVLLPVGRKATWTSAACTRISPVFIWSLMG